MTKHTYEDGPEPVQAGKPKPRKKRNGLLKFLGISAAGAVVGALTVRAVDKHILGKGEPPEPPPPPQPNPGYPMPMMPALPAFPMMPYAAPYGYAPGPPPMAAAPAVSRNPEPDDDDDDDDEDVAAAIEANWEEDGFDE